ncbi:hypothetical protein [Oryzihumus sp.]|uniref:hypothetical protein n=1 Tax=Oryzihumus sp. TaxID=1968903 RepID=UPI002EDBAB68
MSDSTTPRDDENPSDPTAPLWADPTAPMSQEPPSAGSSEPGSGTPAAQPVAPEGPAAPTPPPAAPPAPPSQGTAYPYGQQPGQSPYAPPQPGQPTPYPPQQPFAQQYGQQPYGQQQAPYGQQPYWGQHGQQPPGTPGYYQNPYARGTGTNVSAVVLTVISALTMFGTVFTVGVPSLILGIISLSSHTADPEKSRRLARIGWIVYAANWAVLILLGIVIAVIAVNSSGGNSYNGTY